MLPSNVLFLMSGSIACYKAADLISQLVKRGHHVQVACTESALEFIGKVTLEALTGRPVVSHLFQSEKTMEHIELTKWADVFLLCPATANIINKMAAGIGDDVVSTLFLVYDFSKPFFIAPAMNTNMYNHPMTRQSLEKLQGLGLTVLPTQKGRLACGDYGEGKLLEGDEILRQMSFSFVKNKKSKRVLVVSGGCREAIDGVRSITNLSTGHTGSVLAEECFYQGFDVTYLHALNAEKPNVLCSFVEFQSFSDLREKLKSILEKDEFDLVFHLAAVSDFSVKQIEMDGRILLANEFEKLSSGSELKLVLHPNEKLVDQIYSWSKNSNLKLVAFKLTNSKDSKKNQVQVQDLQMSSKAQLIVHNDASSFIKNRDEHEFTVYQNNQLIAFCHGPKDLSKILIEEFFNEGKTGQENRMNQPGCLQKSKNFRVKNGETDDINA